MIPLLLSALSLALLVALVASGQAYARLRARMLNVDRAFAEVAAMAREGYELVARDDVGTPERRRWLARHEVKYRALLAEGDSVEVRWLAPTTLAVTMTAGQPT